MGNGAKAAQRRDRKIKDLNNSGTSQTKANQAARSIVCSTCKQAFLCTARAPELQQHAENKHSKTMAECFRDLQK